MLTKRWDKARKAFEKRNLEEAKKAHTKQAVAKEKHQQEKGKYIGDTVYGALDGIVTTFAVVAGVTGASLSSSIILILGFANLLADGLSMAAGNYLGTKSEQDYHKKEREREKWEVDNYPQGEIEEIRGIYKAKGFKGKDLERAVKIITSNKERWIKTMMLEELNIIEDRKDAKKAAATTFFSFAIAGFIPLLSYVLATLFSVFQANSFLIAIILTAITIFAVGSARSLIIVKKWYTAGLEMLLVGGVAAIVAYYIGYLLSTLV